VPVTAGNRAGLAVPYYAGTTDITAKVVAGTHVAGSVAPGGSRTFPDGGQCCEDRDARLAGAGDVLARGDEGRCGRGEVRVVAS
jgi:hypothetical protein